MRAACSHCGDASSYAVIAPGDFERTFDYEAEWKGLRLLCPRCGGLISINFGRVSLTNDPGPGLPENLQVHARIDPGPEVIPFPAGRTADSPAQP